MSEENEDAKRIKVVDRRWFTEDGRVREDRPRPAAQPPAAEPKIEAEAEKAPSRVQDRRREAPDAGATERAATSPLFIELVDMLAQQAALLIKGAPGYPAQPAEAKRIIDYLGMLELKTRGNLSVEEQQVVSNLLFQLRSLFVQAGK